MLNLKKQNPIGIFDSGTGGLTVAKAIVEVMPNESIIYFGDTAHLPYGDKSVTAVQSYSLQIAKMLVQQHACKLILIACNAATAASYAAIQQNFSKQVLIANVVDPVISFLGLNYQSKNIGLIGTKLTVNSRIYEKKLKESNSNINLQSLATPLLVPIIEEGFCQHRIMDDMLEEYLAHESLQNIEGLILGCTHYPLVKDKIVKFYAGRTAVIDSSNIVADAVHDLLQKYDLLNPKEQNQRNFYVSDYTDTFALQARQFFGEDVKLEHYPLWK
jgi:glutamate racemase